MVYREKGVLQAVLIAKNVKLVWFTVVIYHIMQVRKVLIHALIN